MKRFTVEDAKAVLGEYGLRLTHGDYFARDKEGCLVCAVGAAMVAHYGDVTRADRAWVWDFKKLALTMGYEPGYIDGLEKGYEYHAIEDEEPELGDEQGYEEGVRDGEAIRLLFEEQPAKEAEPCG